MNRSILQIAVVLLLALSLTACGKPGADGLRDSFAQQMAANRFIKDFQRNGDDLSFSGPGAEGGMAKWRIHIDSAVVEPNDDPAKPYKGTVLSSWYSDDQLIRPNGRDSLLPIELTDNGLGQDCWALWNAAAKKWEW